MNKTLAALLALAVLTACGGPRQRTRLGREQTDTEIPAPAPSVAQYDTATPAGPPVTGGGDTAAVEQAIAAASAAASMPVTGDPRLATLAEWVSERLGPGGDPPAPEVLDFYAWNLGLLEPTPHVVVLGLPDHVSIGEHVQRSVSQFMARQTYTHWGATVMPRSGVWLVVIVLSWRHLSLDPIARELPEGTPIRLRGRLAEGYSNPTIVVQRPGGEVTRQPAGSGPDFDVRVPTTARGAFQVEVIARGPLGETVLANAPVYVGEQPPRTLHLEPEIEDPDAPAPDVATVRAQLLEHLQRTRAQAGLGPLETDPRLDAIALAHSQDMLDHDFLGHVSPRTGSASDRVQRSGVRTGLVLENIGRGYSAAEIHRGLMDSPGHRANLVSSDATHVGIGVVSEEENGRVAFLATQVFIRQAAEIDVASAPERLLAEINQARAARGAPEMHMDDNVQRAAQEAAEAFFADPSLDQQATTERATQSLRRFAIAFRRLGAVMAVVSSLEEARQLEPALDDSVRVTGIGVAQGNRPDHPPNAIAVVIVLAWER